MEPEDGMRETFIPSFQPHDLPEDQSDEFCINVNVSSDDDYDLAQLFSTSESALAHIYSEHNALISVRFKPIASAENETMMITEHVLTVKR